MSCNYGLLGVFFPVVVSPDFISLVEVRNVQGAEELPRKTYVRLLLQNRVFPLFKATLNRRDGI